MILFFVILKYMIYPKRKTRTRVFPIAFFQAACDSCVGDQPEQSTTAQGKCDLRGFAEIRGWLFLMFPHSTLPLPKRRANRRFATAVGSLSRIDPFISLPARYSIHTRLYPLYDPCMALQNSSAPPSFLRPPLATHAPKPRLLFRVEIVFAVSAC